MKLTNPVFENNGEIPSKYTCDGENVNPELQISNVPEGTVSLALIVDDPDIPESVKKSKGIKVWDHWVLFNIDPGTEKIEENSVPREAIEGSNTSGESAYMGPCPPDSQHRYFFKLYALDISLDLDEGVTKEELENAMKGHIIEEFKLIGLYERE